MIITTPLIENHTSRFVGGGHQPEGHMLDYHGSIGKTGITSSTITRYVTIEKEKKKREKVLLFFRLSRDLKRNSDLKSLAGYGLHI